MSRKRDDRTTNDRKRDFLQCYSDTCNVVRAAAAAGIPRSTHYFWLEKDSKYREAYAKRRIRAGDYLESEAVDRATRGWVEPVFYQGAKCGSVRRYSDGLLMLLLRGAKPELYGNKTEISGPQGAPIEAKIEVIFVRPGEVSREE